MNFIKNYDPKAEPTEYAKWIMLYAKKFGSTPATAGIVKTDEQMIGIFKACIDEGKPIDEYLGMGELDPDDEL